MLQTTAVDALLEVRHLKKYFPVKRGLFDQERRFVKAVDDVSFQIRQGQTFGLVGESGCGKSTVGRSILRLIEPTEGEVLFEGQDIVQLNARRLRHKRREFQIVFQDPFSTLNPSRTIGQIISEPFFIQQTASRREAMDKSKELLELVGIRSDAVSRHPHEFSGGQRQRISIARALAVNPKLIVCDESVSALDVSIQAQIINLLDRLQHELGLAYLFISHDLRVVKHVSDTIAVMYLGAIVETAPVGALFSNPRHPYTISLLSAIPASDPDIKKKRITLVGDVPSPMNLPEGCRFHTRCFRAREICRIRAPISVELEPGHWCACHLHDQ